MPGATMARTSSMLGSVIVASFSNSSLPTTPAMRQEMIAVPVKSPGSG